MKVVYYAYVVNVIFTTGKDLSTKFDSFDSLGDDVGHLKDEEDVGVLLLQLGKAWVVF